MRNGLGLSALSQTIRRRFSLFVIIRCCLGFPLLQPRTWLDSAWLTMRFVTWNQSLTTNQVVLGFVLPAYTAAFLLIIFYVFGFLPRSMLNAADLECFRARPRNIDTKWHRGLEKMTIAVANQSIIPGIDVLLAGFASLVPSANRGGTSVYHWQIVIYLAWMSSNVHLSALSMLHDRLKLGNPMILIRLSFMACLLVLLLIAMIPTANSMWPDFTVHGRSDSHSTSRCGADASCFWANRESGNPDALFSYVLLLLGYLWKVI